jgi:hypothetical protein
MQKFGIEIRKTGDTKNLYRDVDLVLKTITMDGGSVSDVMRSQAVAHSLQKMLKSDGHLSVCTIDNCASICQIMIPKERRDIYSSCHCMSYSEMLPEFRVNLVAMLLDDFRTVLCQD